jgi:5-bromo-4-chloroindolyl phosphate hydrolysis protein
MLDEELTGQIRLKEECSHLREALEEANDKISTAEKTLVELQS